MRYRVLAALAVLAFLVPAPRLAEAAKAEFKVFYFPVNGTFTSTTPPNGTWNTPVFGGDVRWFIPLTPYGVHLQYATGNQGTFGGGFAGATGGTDRTYFGDVFYEWQFVANKVRLFAGYGAIESNTNFGALTTNSTSRGFRVGTDFVIPFPNTNLAFLGGFAWYPSNSTNLTTSVGAVSVSASSTASANDWFASVQYTDPKGWLFEAGYRQISADSGTIAGCPCNFKFNGPFFSVGYWLR